MEKNKPSPPLWAKGHPFGDTGRPFSDEDLFNEHGLKWVRLHDHTDAKEVRRWIKAMCYFSNCSPTSLAKIAGFAPSTLTKYIYNEDTGHQIRPATLSAIEVAAWMAFDLFLKAADKSPDLSSFDIPPGVLTEKYISGDIMREQLDRAIDREEGCVFAPKDYTRDSLLGWITELCRLAGVTRSALAKKAGLTPSTLTRFFKKDGAKTLNVHTLSAVEGTAKELVLARYRLGALTSDDLTPPQFEWLGPSPMIISSGLEVWTKHLGVDESLFVESVGQPSEPELTILNGMYSNLLPSQRRIVVRLIQGLQKEIGLEEIRQTTVAKKRKLKKQL